MRALLVPETTNKVKLLFQRSIFFKLLVIYVTTTILLIIAIRGTIHRAFGPQQMLETSIGQNFLHHATQIIAEIGDPPSREQASRLAAKLELPIRIESDHESWATDSTLPILSTLDLETIQADDPLNGILYGGLYHGRPVFVFDRSETRLGLFFLQRPPIFNFPGTVIVLIVGVVTLILSGSYFMVRRLFRPIHWLVTGVEEVGKGNLDYHVPRCSSDELGKLTQSFNDMTQRVRDMIRARDRLLVDVSHELRSPLTRMKVALEFVPDDQTKEKIQHDIRELETMLTEVLESERLTSDFGQLVHAKTDLIALVNAVVEGYANRKPGVRVVSSIPFLHLTLDRDRVRIAIRNVIENAVKYSPPNNRQVEVHIVQDASTVSVSIQDHGPGIPPDDQPLIFEPFYRVDKSRTRDTGGYGLGLSLAKKIMVAHGGDLTLSSEFGHGATFTLRFPTS